MSIDYKIYIPSGNPTILVKGIPDKEEKIRINDYLIDEYQFVEQVGFVSEDCYELEMAGGEFCGNATRCAVHYYLDGRKGDITIKVNDNYLEGGIRDEQVWITMPVAKSPLGKIVTTVNDKAIVRLDGITHVVVEKDMSGFDEPPVKEAAREIMEELDLLGEDACGVMFISYTGTRISLTPVVWVRDINTLFYETACGSGTTAVGIYQSMKDSANADIDVIQPSKDIINVKVTLEGDSVDKAIICGKVKKYEH